MSDYRDTLYGRYVSGFQQRPDVPATPAATARQFRIQAYHLRDWLPAALDANILDAGCGAGELLAFFQHRGYANIQGVDVSPEQVELCRRVTPRVAQGDVLEYLAATEGQFDLISAMDLVEHLSKDELLRFLTACRRALKPGGRIIIQTPNPGSPFFGEIRYGDLTHEQALTPKLLERLLALHGFGDVSCREAGPVPVSGAKGLVRWILWQVICTVRRAYDLVECGGSHGIYTRVYLCSAIAR